MERLKSELLQEIDFLLITIAKSTLLLKSVYKKLYITVITHFVFIVFYSIATVYFTFLITTKTLYVLFLVAQIVMQICLIAYYQQQKKYQTNIVQSIKKDMKLGVPYLIKLIGEFCARNFIIRKIEKFIL